MTKKLLERQLALLALAGQDTTDLFKRALTVLADAGAVYRARVSNGAKPPRARVEVSYGYVFTISYCHPRKRAPIMIGNTVEPRKPASFTVQVVRKGRQQVPWRLTPGHAGWLAKRCERKDDTLRVLQAIERVREDCWERAMDAGSIVP